MSVRDFRREIQWTVLVLVLAVLAVIALWPRDQGESRDSATRPRPEPSVSAQQRSAAALQPCPNGPGGPAALAGITATCLATGAPVDLASTLGGGPTLINFWATWCVPCRTELPALEAYQRQPGAIRVLGVQVESDQAGGLDLLRSLGVHFPVVYDGDNRVRAALRMPNVLPVSYVVTAGGDVRRIDPPVAFTSPDQVRAAVERTLGGQ